jgi:hypothetical protein
MTCNYCRLQQIRYRAKVKYKTVTVIGDAVYVHPVGVDIHKMTQSTRDIYFVTWLVNIPDHCICKES